MNTAPLYCLFVYIGNYSAIISSLNLTLYIIKLREEMMAE